MDSQKIKIELRKRRKARIRAKIYGTQERPRISVYKSNRHIWGQVVDDGGGKTLLAQSDAEVSEKKLKEFKSELKGKTRYSFLAGMILADKMKEKKISKAVFDRGGFKYHGRLKAFADGIRHGGIKI